MADRPSTVLPKDMSLSFGTPAQPTPSAVPAGSMGSGNYTPNEEALLGSMRMSEALARAAADSPLVAAKKASVQNSSLQKMAVYGTPMEQRVLATAVQQGSALGQRPEVQDIFLDPISYAAKYGFQAEQDRAGFGQAYLDVNQLKAAERTGAQAAGDLAIDLGVGVTNLFGGAAVGLAALGDAATGFLFDAPAVSPYLSMGLDWATQGARGFQSDLMQQRRVQQNIEADLKRQDTEAAYQADLAQNADATNVWDRSIRPWLSKQAGTVGDVVSNYADDPMMLGSLGAEGVGSLIPVGLAAKGIGAARAAAEIASKGLTGKAAQAVVAREAERAVPALIGLTEGGSAVSQTQQQIMSMSEADLMKSPEYRDMRNQGQSHDEAQLALARNAGVAAGLIAAPGAVLAGKLVAGFEARPFAGALNPLNGLKNVAREGSEEFLQESQSQVAGNIAMDQVAGINTPWDKGAVEAGTAGFLGGAMAAGGLQAPGAALGTAGAAASLAKDAVVKASQLGAEAISAQLAKVTARNDKASPVGTPARAKAAEQFTAVGEAMLADLGQTTPNQTKALGAASNGTSGDGTISTGVDQAPGGNGPDLTQASPQDAGNDAQRAVAGDGRSNVGSVQDGVDGAAQTGQQPDPLTTQLTRSLYLDDTEVENYTGRYQRLAEIKTENPDKPLSRAVAILAVEDELSNPKVAEDDKIVASITALSTFDEMRKIESSDVTAAVMATPEGSVQRKGHEALTNQIRVLESSPVLKSARQRIESLTPEKVAELIPLDLLKTGDATTKAELTKILSMIGQINPLAVPDQTYATVLDQVSDTTPNNDEVRRNLKLAREIAGQFSQADMARSEIRQAYDAAVAKLGESSTGYASFDIVRKQIKTQGNRNNGLPSLDARRADIMDALRIGRTDLAQQGLAALGDFAQHMSNKVAALNRSSMNKGQDTPFQALGPLGWFEDKKGVFVRTNNPASMALAREVQVDADTTVGLYNALARVVAEMSGDKAPALLKTPKLNGKIEASFKALATTAAADAAPAQTAPTQATTEAQDAQAQTPTVQPTQTSDQAPVEDPAQSVDAAPAPVQKVTDTTVVTEEEPEVETQQDTTWFEGLKTRLYKAAEDANLFLKAYRPRTTDGSLLVQEENPAMMVIENIENLMRPENGMTRELTTDETMALQDLIGNEEYGIAAFASDLDQMVEDRINKPSRKDGTTWADLMYEGREVHGYENGLILNFLVEKQDGGGLEVEPRVAAALYMAMKEWAIQNLSTGRPWLKDDKVNEFFGVPRGEQVTEQMRAVIQFGQSHQQVVEAIAEKLTNLLGVQAKTDVTSSLSQGMMKSLAANALEWMLDKGLIEVNSDFDVKVWSKDLGKPIGTNVTVPVSKRNPAGKRNTTMIRLSPKAKGISALKTLQSIRDPFSRIFTKAAERDRYIGKPPKQTKETQLGNPFARISELGRKVIQQRNKTPSYINEMMVGLLDALGDENWKALMGYTPLTTEAKDSLNRNHLIKIEGKNLSLDHAVSEVRGYVEEARAYGEAQGQTLGEVQIFHDHALSSVGRLQQIGPITMQGDKTAREMMSSTFSTLDLKNEAHINTFWLAVAQSVGLKVEKEPHRLVKFLRRGKDFPALTKRGIRKEVQSLFTTNRKGLGLQPAVKIARTYLTTGKLDAAAFMEALWSAKDLEGKAFEITPKLVHAVMSVAQFQEANLKKNLAKTTAFKTALALEADGRTDGPVNAMIHMGIGAYMDREIGNTLESGAFSAEEIERFAKGGLFFTGQQVSLNDFIEAEYRAARDQGLKKVWGEDLYHLGARLFEDQLKALYGDTKTSTADVLRFLDAFLPNFTKDAKIHRNTVKNPLTVFLYGSSVSGIAAKIAGEAMGTFYEVLSDALSQQKAGKTRLLGQHPGFAKHAGIFEVMARLIGTDYQSLVRRFQQDPAGFSLSTEEFTNLRSAVEKGFADPMSTAIDQATGGLAGVMKFTQQASTIQTAIFQDLLNKAMAEKLAELRKPDANGKAKLGPMDLLSEKDMREVFTELMSIAPIFSTSGEAFQISAPVMSTMDEGKGKVAASLSGRFTVEGRQLTGDEATVKVSPYMTIGTGDGRMILNIYAEADGSLQASLPVFDGVEQSLAHVTDDSNKINQAVFEGWTGQNIYRSLADGFWQMLVSMTPEIFDSLNTETKTEIRKALKLKPGTAPTLVDLRKMHRRLEAMGIISEARKAAISRMATQTDHMAGAMSPYGRDGVKTSSDNPLDFAAIAETMNGLYAEELVRLRSELKAKSEPKASYAQKPSPELMARVKELGEAVEGHPGVTRLRGEQLLALLSQVDGVSKAELDLVTVLAKGMDDSIYYFGNGPALEKARDALHGDLVKRPIQLGQSHPAAGVSFIANQAPETVLHEMLHVLTLGILEKHYADPAKSPEHVRGAVKRLEGLMREVVQMNPAMVLGVDASALTGGSAFEILQDTLSNPTLSKAGQISELISYMLTNQDLIQIGQKKKVYAPLIEVIKRGLAYFKRLLGYAAQPGDTLFSNIRFNTEVLLAKSPALEQAEESARTETVLDQVFPPSAKLSGLEHSFLDRLHAHLEATRPADPGVLGVNQKAFEAEVTRLELAAKAAADLAVAAGFTLNAREGMAFRAIHKAMNSGISLDPALLRQVNELYSHVVDSLRPEDFLKADGIEGQPTAEEMARAKARADFVVTARKTMAQDKRTDTLATFLALAQAEEGFRSVLAQTAAPKQAQVKWDSVDNAVEGLSSAVTNVIMTLSLNPDAKGRTVQARLDALAEGLSKEKGERQAFAMVTQMTDIVTKVNSVAADYVRRGSEAASTWLADQAKNAKKAPLKLSLNVAASVAGLGSKEMSMARGEALTTMLNHVEGWNTLRSLLNDLRGATKDNIALLRLVNRVKSSIEAFRQAYREQIPEELAKGFSRRLSREEWSATHKAFGRADLLALGLDEALALVKDPASVKDRILDLEEKVDAMGGKFASRYRSKSKALARYMVLRVNTSRHLLRNAHAIANLYGEQGKYAAQIKKLARNKDLVQAIDQLTTLYAYQLLDGKTRLTLAQLMETETDGLSQLAAYHRAVRQAEIERLDDQSVDQGVAFKNGWKGYVPEIQEDGAAVIVADDDRFDELSRLGYTRIGDYRGDRREAYAGKRGYYQSAVAGRNAFRQGVAQTVHDSYLGVDAQTGYTRSGGTAGAAVGDWVGLAAQLTEKHALRNDGLPAGEYLMPVFGIGGQVVGYERSMNPDMSQGIQTDTHLGRMLGAWMGRIVEEKLADEFNKDLVKTLHEIWLDQKDSRGVEFINVADPDIKDPVIRDAWATLGWKIKEDATEAFGRKDVFMIRKDMVDDAIGFRSAGVRDLWTGVSRLSEGKRDAVVQVATALMGNHAYKLAVQGSRITDEFMSWAKTNIVVRSTAVILDNITSNILHLSLHGIDPITIALSMRKKFVELTQYTKNRRAQLKAEVELAAGIRDPEKVKRVKAKLRALEEANDRLSIAPLIRAGELSTVSEGLTEDDVAMREGKIGAHLEKLASALPGWAGTATKNVLITKDTALFRFLNRMVQAGDFLAKATLYDHLTQKKGQSEQEALDTVMEEFVQYNRLPGRGRDYLENIGLLWFYSYKLRIQKIALKMWRERPLQSLMVMGGVGPMSGVDTAWSGSLLGKGADGGLGWSIGPSMGITSYRLNPWINGSDALGL